MLQYHGVPIMEYWKLRGIAKKVRNGIVPKGADQETIFKALRLTRPSNVTEMFGFLSAKVTPADGSPERDLGIVSCRKVTKAFAKRLVDAMLSSGEIIDHFNQHKQGSGSTAEASGDINLVTPDSVCQAVTGGAACTHGASSNIYRTIGTLVASTAYEIREHGVFCASTAAGSYVLLDRSVVTAIAVNADDTVTWTYNLTIDSET